jgi:dnd system-associated protein 4
MYLLRLPNVKINIDKRVHNIYEQLTKRAAEDPESFPFENMKSLFMAAACVGAKCNQFKELGSKDDIFEAMYLDPDTEVPILAALAYHKEKDIEVLKDPKRIIEIAEGYANGGITILSDQVLDNPGTPLDNLVDYILKEEEESV